MSSGAIVGPGTINSHGALGASGSIIIGFCNVAHFSNCFKNRSLLSSREVINGSLLSRESVE
jgi:hypothetical protein